MGVRREERITMSVGSLVRIWVNPRRAGLAIFAKADCLLRGGRELAKGYSYLLLVRCTERIMCTVATAN